MRQAEEQGPGPGQMPGVQGHQAGHQAGQGQQQGNQGLQGLQGGGGFPGLPGFQGLFGGQAPQGFQDPPRQELQDRLPELLPGVLPDEFMQRERRARDTDWDDPINRSMIDKAVIRLFRDKKGGPSLADSRADPKRDHIRSPSKHGHHFKVPVGREIQPQILVGIQGPGDRCEQAEPTADREAMVLQAQRMELR